MSIIPTDLAMDRIVDILKAGIGTRFVDLPNVVAEGSKVFVIWVIHQYVYGALKAGELSRHGVENLILF